MNKGFFDIPLIDNTQPPREKPILGCDFCGLCKRVKSPKIPMSGQGKLKIFILSESPGATEDSQNTQLVGEAGQLLRKDLITLGYDLDHDFHRDNSLGCRPTDSNGNNRPPEWKELECCESRWRDNLRKVRPRVIFLMGGKAVEIFFHNRSRPITEDLTIGRFRRLCIPDPETKTWVISLYHPSFSVRNPDTHPIFLDDLKWALEKSKTLTQRPEFPNWEEKVRPVTDFETLNQILVDLNKATVPISFDYETSGIRPYREGHKIWSIAFSAQGSGSSIAFPYQYPGAWKNSELETIAYNWAQFLYNKKIKKVAQNLQFEEKWNRRVLGVKTEGWFWDTMNTAHVVDERPKFTSLDFQVFINWGYEYGQEITKFKNSLDGEFNQMHQVPLHQLLVYNGLDALFTSKLQARQFDHFYNTSESKSSMKYKAANRFWFQGTLTHCEIEDEGININVPYYEKQKKMLDDRSEFLIKSIWRSPANQEFKKIYGKDIEISKNEDIKKLFFNVLHLEPLKKTEKGNISVDVHVLEKMEHPIAKKIIKIRQLQKVKSAYAEGFLRLQVNGKLRPSYNLNIARSMRSSASDPNVQNLPRKDKSSMQMIRGGIIPPPGFKIGEADYASMEVRIIASVSLDPILINLIENNGDPHTEWAEFMDLNRWKEKKEARFDAKNAFVFALFYGSYSGNIWPDLVGRGYKELKESSVQKAEKEFWNKSQVVKQYQEKQIEKYRETGYVEMVTGFRRRGWLTRNEIANTAIQGPAFHCLLWSLNHLIPLSKNENWKSRIFARIHDSMLIYMCPGEEEHTLSACRRIMTEDIRKVWKWIVVPLDVEFQVAGIDQPWTAKEDIEVD